MQDTLRSHEGLPELTGLSAWQDRVARGMTAALCEDEELAAEAMHKASAVTAQEQSASPWQSESPAAEGRPRSRQLRRTRPSVGLKAPQAG